MRFMVLVKADADTEAGKLPTKQELAEMWAYNEQLANAGVLLGGDGLQASSKGARVRFSGGKTAVTDGPFTESKELIAGYWLMRADSLEEVIEWVRQAPFREAELEIRQVFESEDFGEAFTPELREREERMRTQLEGHQEAGTGKP